MLLSEASAHRAGPAVKPWLKRLVIALVVILFMAWVIAGLAPWWGPWAR